MPSLFATTREFSGITFVDLSGRISLGDGSALLRKTVRDLLDEGRVKIVLNLTKKVNDLLQLTKLFTVFEVYNDEPSAVGSFNK